MGNSNSLSATSQFDDFVRIEGRRLQHTLVAAHGLAIGSDAAQAALVYCWEHWSRVAAMDNPCGYLFRVGQNAARREYRPVAASAAAEPVVLADFEPGLVNALRDLTEHQREAANSAASVDINTVDVGPEPDQDLPEAEADPEEGLSETETDGDHSQSTGLPNLMPTPVAAADFGAADVRYLPSTDSGFVVADGLRILLSEANLGPEIAIPVRTQRVTLPATDPADRRGIVLVMSTYATPAEADAVIEAEPTAHGRGEPVDVAGMSGAWHEEEGFAPYSAGNPMRIIGALRVRLAANTVLDATAADVSLAELETLVASLVISEEGLLETPTPPAGFAGAEPISARNVFDHRSTSDYLSLGLVGVTGERVSLTISAQSDGFTATGAHFETASGYGWIEAGLFGETVVSFVGPEVALRLVNYDGQVSADELIALAGAVQPVDDQTWVEQLKIAPLFDSPVSTVPIED